MRQELLRMERVVCQAEHGSLSGLRLNLYRGEVLLVQGLHDAGQQALVDVLSGRSRPQSGAIWVDETPAELSSMDAARALGIYSVLQDTRLVPDLTVAENIFAIRRSRLRRGIVHQRAMKRQTKSILDWLGMDISPDTPARQLSVADQHLIEIAKNVALGAKLIVNDDLRLPYTHRELDRLKTVVRRYAEQGVSFLIVSRHNDELSDPYALADRILVLRDGENVGELRETEFHQERLVGLMVGREFRTPERPSTHTVGPELLRAEHLHNRSGLSDVSFSVHSGEVVGLLDLSRRSNLEIAAILTGAGQLYEGQLRLAGEPVEFHTLKSAIEAGIGYIPEESMDIQLPDCLTAAENLSLIRLRQRRPGPFLKRKARNLILYQDSLPLLGLPADSSDLPIRTLPAAARLRLLYLRWILARCRLLVCVKPSTMLDVLLRDAARSMLDLAASRGMGVLVVSSDPSEVAELCDRIVILSGGVVRDVLSRQAFLMTDLSNYY